MWNLIRIWLRVMAARMIAKTLASREAMREKERQQRRLEERMVEMREQRRRAEREEREPERRLRRKRGISWGAAFRLMLFLVGGLVWLLLREEQQAEEESGDVQAGRFAGDRPSPPGAQMGEQPASAGQTVAEPPAQPMEAMIPQAEEMPGVQDQPAQAEIAEAEVAPPAVAQADTEDLTVIEGIGPRINELMHQHGIRTYQQLAEAEVNRLEEILRQAGLAMANPATWPEQARLVQAGDWQGLESMKAGLNAGRRSGTAG